MPGHAPSSPIAAGSVIAGRAFADIEARWEQQLGQHRMAQLRTMLSELAGLAS